MARIYARLLIVEVQNSGLNSYVMAIFIEGVYALTQLLKKQLRNVILDSVCFSFTYKASGNLESPALVQSLESLVGPIEDSLSRYLYGFLHCRIGLLNSPPRHWNNTTKEANSRGVNTR